jgi:hypothetical protein
VRPNISCNLDRGPELLHSWPLSPDAKLSKEAGPYNPANVAIQQGEMPWVYYRLRPAFSCRLTPDGPQMAIWELSVRTEIDASRRMVHPEVI